MTPSPVLPSISVVVPSLQQGAFLEHALESIFRQEYPRLEVAVLDGGSTDGSVAILRRFADRLAYWRSERDQGQSAAINEGVRRTGGTLVAWLNADDLYWDDCLWTVGHAYAAFPDHGLYVGNGLRLDESGGLAPFCRHHLALDRAALARGLDYLLQPATFVLREAWQAVGGLRPDLRYCMDWELFQRVAERYPAVLINDFLAASREHATTKTRTGGMARAIEILGVIQERTGEELTPGSLYYLLESVLQATEGRQPQAVRGRIYDAMLALRGEFAREWGNADGFPERSDPQDRVFVTGARNHDRRRSIAGDETLPSLSLVIPSFNQAAFLGRALESTLSQEYPGLELLVMDGGSSDGSLDVLRAHADRLAHCVSEPDRGPAHALNKGLALARGEVLGWLNSDDLLARDALWQIGRAFARDPELDMLFANALYVDENERVVLADHGWHRTGLYFGELQPWTQIPYYWRYVHAVPQPTVFFRRRLLERCGGLDERYALIFDFELFWRFTRTARVRKLERTLAFYRIHSRSKTGGGWRRFQVELYRFSRPLWPSLFSRAGRATLRDFVGTYMRQRFAGRARDTRFWCAALAVALSAGLRIGNPEAWRLPQLGLRRRGRRAPAAAEPSAAEPDSAASDAAQRLATGDPASAVAADDRARRYRSLFCSFLWPLHPGHSGGEIRDFHLLQALLRHSSVEFVAVYPSPAEGREDLLHGSVDALRVPPAEAAATAPRPSRLPRMHADAACRVEPIASFAAPAVEQALATRDADFLFVSPQLNPLPLLARLRQARARVVLASYDVEAVRVERLVAAGADGLDRADARRAARFERLLLSVCDGVIAVSELDQSLFAARYGVEPERILVAGNGVDSGYFAFQPRPAAGAACVVFVASFAYWPNRQAAWRLLRGIMPLVWRSRPEVRLELVGQQPDPGFAEAAPGRPVRVTGRVADVRPHLAHASLACVPLLAGSGTKYKVLEALSAGVPVVCTPLALEGLQLRPPDEALAAGSDEELAEAILRVLASPALARSLAERGRAAVERAYTWERQLAGLGCWLERMAALPRRGANGAPAASLAKPVRLR